eukprot:TRINITY_DN4677_c0_g1_i1.p1 TRINITY_DN4677_c0_g1~~TRINITY_DN4677_c0_g1_i1.p1  ORF type:complete len:176 (-),score=4.42 TRINITY_DN4677_c0_g1_i1:120-590(-)
MQGPPQHPYFEHINVTVSNFPDMQKFLTCAFPTWNLRVRGEGEGKDRFWQHFGNDFFYFALEHRKPEDQEQYASNPRKPYHNYGVNHVAIVTQEDLNELTKRMEEAGYKHTIKGEGTECRRREYFLDPTGNEWEIVQYLSDEPAKRNAGYPTKEEN